MPLKQQPFQTPLRSLTCTIHLCPTSLQPRVLHCHYPTQPTPMKQHWRMYVLSTCTRTPQGSILIADLSFSINFDKHEVTSYTSYSIQGTLQKLYTRGWEDLVERLAIPFATPAPDSVLNEVRNSGPLCLHHSDYGNT